MILKNEILDFSIPPNPIVTYSPIVFAMPERQVPLQVKVSAPATGTNLPIILLSHGHGQSNFLASLHGYAPLVNFYASKGFVVIQPTHQNSKSLHLTPTEHDGDLFWRSRAEDMHFILDNLEEIEKRVPFLNGRLNKEKIAAIGHSLGGHTVSLLTGMLIKDPDSGEEINYTDKRIKASILMGAPGNGADLAPAAAKRFPILMHNSFAEMVMPALIVTGDKDQNPMFSARDDWRSDAYFLSNGPKTLLTIFDGEHILGGISGYDTNESTDESLERVALVQEYTLAYLRSALYPEDTSWNDVQQSLEKSANPLGKIESKGYSN